MSDGTSRDRDEELLLARISAAGGRAHLGRRRATYRAAPRGDTARAGRGAAIRLLWQTVVEAARRLWRAGGRTGANAGARLDFYEHGMTAAVDGRIHVIRYDTTVVRRRRVLSPQGITHAHVLIDVNGERIVLRGGDFGHPEVWGPEIRRAVTEAQVPRALAALAEGARLTFGSVWITSDEIGSRGTSLRWPQVQRIEISNGSVAIRVAGRWQVLGPVASGIPNPFVFHALAEHLAGAERDDD
ncbi:DUF6585 family protein [Streptomyces scopuliridis]|uniref:DUF6585 family protein n=1 Tax=Streptomyces scopuliridis TaxID=452529 RepID=UPI0004C2AE51|nr:DUF6585 family protein [Streptomyces scopuliridis]